MQIKPKNILFIHQSTDLYGSDKTLLYLVKELDRGRFNPIIVLPDKGSLYKEFEKLQIKTIITPVIKVHRGMFTIRTFVKLPFQIIRSIRTLNKELKEIKIHVIQSNTVVVFLGAIFAKRYGIRHFWHIHEIIKTPRIAAKFFSSIVYYFSDKVIFNSNATRQSFLKYQLQLEKKSIIIYNGIDNTEETYREGEIKQLRQDLKINERDILFGLFGRINENKGHELLLSVFKRLNKKIKNIKLLIIGSTIQGKEVLLSDLKNKLVEDQLTKDVIILPFQKNIWKFWNIIDVAIVPSTIPESFGLVALEAMLSKKAVIASKEGGLTEIVLDNETGILFETNNQDALEEAMMSFLNNREIISLYGNEGYKRAIEKFTLKKYIENFEKIYSIHIK